MKNLIFLLSILTCFGVCAQSTYHDIINYKRKSANEKMLGENSILDSLEKENFVSLNYFEIDTNYIVEAVLIKDKGPKFKMLTSTDRRPNYRRFGYVEFVLNDTLTRLTVYSNLDYNKKTKTKDYLFLPVKDATSPVQTYGAGRYLDLKYNKLDKIELDFNKLYNPYCAYSHNYSCPVTPEENKLNTLIQAGEKLPTIKDIHKN